MPALLLFVQSWFARFLSIVLLFVWGMVTIPAQAAKKVELYAASQLVLDESPAIRNQAASTGLKDVIVRVSGNPLVLENPEVKQALARASTYLLRYSYQSTDETITILGDTRSARRLSMQFSPASIQRLFKTARLPIWPDTRPEVLLWVSNGGALLDAEAAEIFAVKAAADIRGLPISAPLLDLTDRQQLPPARIRALDETSIRNASSRYDLDAVLAGRVSSTGSGSAPWRANFILLDDAGRQYFRAAAATLEQATRQIIDQATDYLAGKESIVVTDGSFAPSVNIVVNNIQGFEAYAGLVTYLKTLPVVASVMVSQVDGSSVKLALSYNGTADKLLSTLSGSEVLEALPLVVGVPPADLSVSAEYRWR